MGHGDALELAERVGDVVEVRLAELVHDAALAFFAEQAVAPRWRYHGVQDYAQLMTLVAAGQGRLPRLVHPHVASVPYDGVAVRPLGLPAVDAPH